MNTRRLLLLLGLTAILLFLPGVPTQHASASSSVNTRVESLPLFRQTVSCDTYSSTDIPKAIPNPGTLDNTLTISTSEIIYDVNVIVGQITHPQDVDLYISLIHPDGTIVELSVPSGAAGANYTNTHFDDDAGIAFWLGTPPYNGTYHPRGSLAALDGKNTQGNWRLRVIDNNYGNEGTLESWSLEICHSPSDFTLDVTPSLRDVCQPDNAGYNIAVGALAGFDSAVNLTVSGAPAGTTVSFNPQPVTPTGSGTSTSLLTISSTGAATPGSYPLTIRGTSGSLTRTDSVTLNLYGSLPVGASLTAPADGATNVQNPPPFTWTDPGNEAGYIIEIASDPDLTNIVHTATLTANTTSYNAATLEEDTLYYWRVRTINPCGEASSPTYAFRMGGCSIISSADVPKTIPDFDMVESILSIPSSKIITDVNVLLGQITHPLDSDLDIYLIHPDGTQVELSTDNGLNGDNYTNTRFDDEAATAITAGAAPFTGSYRPEGSLAALDGKNTYGTWRLRVADDIPPNSGLLQSWSLEVCGHLFPDFTFDAAPASLNVCQPDDAGYDIAIGALSGFNSAVNLSVSGAPGGTLVSFNPLSVTPPGTSTSHLTISNTAAATPGSYPLTITGTSGSLTHTDNVTLNLYAPIPAGASLTAPVNGATNVQTTPTFTWSDAGNEMSYTIEIASDPGFANIIHTATLPANTTSYNAATLADNTLYHWRVRTINPCGATNSSAYSFRTMDCMTISSAEPEVPKALPDFVTVESTLTFPSSEIITDVDVILGQITHVWDEDLDISLVHPDGTLVELSTDNGGSGDNYTNTRFDDEAATTITTGTASFTGSYRPEGSLAVLDGKNTQGIWRLRIRDDTSPDAGTLQSWSLAVCWAPAATAVNLFNFAAQATSGSVHVTWQTVNTTDFVGFYVLRAEMEQGPYVRLNEAMLTVDGSTYSWDDTSAQAGTSYYYKVEMVGADGVSQFSGPMLVESAPAHRVYLPVLR